MIEGDSVKIERARVKRRALNKKRGPKLWRWRVARLKRVKFRKRTRWARYHDERDAKRCAWPRPYLKAIRLTWRPLPEAVASRAARIRERHNQRRAR